MELSARDVMEQRMTTLRSLLETPGGPLGPQAGGLGGQLAERWRVELRLIERILDETPDSGRVIRTLDLWHERTGAFLSASSAEDAGWTDRQGRRWRAAEVLELLDDLRDRLASWRRLEPDDSPAPPAARSPSGDAAEPADGSGPPSERGGAP